jgi:hypothetical protein
MLLNQYSLLAHVAPGLTTQFENLATESPCLSLLAACAVAVGVQVVLIVRSDLNRAIKV